MEQHTKVIDQAYKAFNARDVDTALSLMHQNVHWPNGWEGGYVQGHNEVRDYWARQWEEINPIVEPIACKQNQSGQIEVDVHQVVKDMQGTVLFNGLVKHVYTFDNGLITNMSIEKP